MKRKTISPGGFTVVELLLLIVLIPAGSWIGTWITVWIYGLFDLSLAFWPVFWAHVATAVAVTVLSAANENLGCAVLALLGIGSIFAFIHLPVFHAVPERSDASSKAPAEGRRVESSNQAGSADVGKPAASDWESSFPNFPSEQKRDIVKSVLEVEPSGSGLWTKKVLEMILKGESLSADTPDNKDYLREKIVSISGGLTRIGLFYDLLSKEADPEFRMIARQKVATKWADTFAGYFRFSRVFSFKYALEAQCAMATDIEACTLSGEAYDQISVRLKEPAGKKEFTELFKKLYTSDKGDNIFRHRRIEFSLPNDSPRDVLELPLVPADTDMAGFR